MGVEYSLFFFTNLNAQIAGCISRLSLGIETFPFYANLTGQNLSQMMSIFSNTKRGNIKQKQFRKLLN
jgi:hypothetical protein